MRTTLTIEQSATLISKGISAERASAFDDIRTVIDSVPTFCPGTVPIFTLADLLSLLPKELDTTYLLTIVGGSKYWYANYAWNECYDRDWSKDDELGLFTGEKELIDALYNLLLWIIDHNHVKLD